MIAVPTLSQLITRVKGDMNAAMGNSNALITRSLAWVVAHVVAGVAWAIYQTVVFLAKQVIPDTAEDDYLERWARLFLGTGPLAATQATGTVIVTAIAGSSVVNGTILARDDGEEYAVTGGPYNWAAAGQQNVTVQAMIAGASGNYDYAAGAALTFASPPAGVQASAPLGPIAAPAGFTGGVDEESDDELQGRIRDRLSDPPQGGSDADYVAWAQAADASVDRVWVQRWPQAGMAHGEVTVRFIVEGTGAGVIPGAAVIAIVAAYINVRKPVTAEPGPAGIAAAPAAEAITMTIRVHGDGTATETEVYAAILAELESAFRERAEVDPAGSTFRNSYLQEAIGNAAGVDWFTITLLEGGAGTADIALGANEYPTIVAGGITHDWIP